VYSVHEIMRGDAKMPALLFRYSIHMIHTLMSQCAVHMIHVPMSHEYIRITHAQMRALKTENIFDPP
jgi:hypothetical protein